MTFLSLRFVLASLVLAGCSPHSPLAMPSVPIPSAQVLLRPADGPPPGPETVITSENVRAFAPTPEAVTQALLAFEQLGFEVGEFVGISFSITAEAETFERAFDVRLVTTERGGLQARRDGSEQDELPLDALPESLGRLVHTVTFVPPPDFGPGSF
jgi:hypothetical protein